jgi:Helicase conserved C-terminal domain
MTPARGQPPDARVVLDKLKAFQRKTVEYAFRRLYTDPDSTHRFLVADEVGLGKTMVARGVIAKAVELLWGTVDRIDVVYVCSNADIARQNINRLQLDRGSSFARATRATLLPVELREMASRRVNFVSMTPGTSLEPRSGFGIAEERALLFEFLRGHWKLSDREGLNLFKGNMKRLSFRDFARDWIGEQAIDAKLRQGFLENLERKVGEERRAGKRTLHTRVLEAADGSFSGYGDDDARRGRREVVAELRAMLGKSCIGALRPDLVIVDEFQRFKHLLDPANEDAELARSLFEYADHTKEHQEAVRVLLLSATPYKMYSLAHEQGSPEADHYEDFLATYRFLVRGDATKEGSMREALREYRRALVDIQDGSFAKLRDIKVVIERHLREVMSRTERLASTSDRSGMLRECESKARLAPSDVRQYLLAADVARAVGHGEIVEYSKSAPYLLNFMDEYKLKEEFASQVAEGASDELRDALVRGESQLLSWSDIAAYRPIDPANARLRELLDETVERNMWRMLWLPPSLPYYALDERWPCGRPEALTKRLVFSSWNVVPKVIASVVSHEVERRMMAESYESAGQVSVANTPEGRKKIGALLRFSRAEGRLTGLLYPSHALARALDPAHRGSVSRSAAELLREAENALRCGVQEAVDKWSNAGEVDERWYWACPMLLDRLANEEAAQRFWTRQGLPNEWSGADDRAAKVSPEEAGDEDSSDSAWAAHIGVAREVALSAFGDRPLGAPPPDLLDVLAKACLGSPAVVALRALARPHGPVCLDAVEARIAAGRVAWKFRNLFNLHEVTALVRGWSPAEPYWRSVIEYAIAGCLQSVLDEYAHVLADSLGAANLEREMAVESVADEMCSAIGLRRAAIDVDDIRVDSAVGTVRHEPRRMQARFAVRFGQWKGDREHGDRDRAGQVRAAFNSPFWPFVLASTSVGQEGLDFHHYCHAVVHWNLPSNPVDLEQREGRIHRYKGHAVRKNVAKAYAHRTTAPFGDIWADLFAAAAADEASKSSDLNPFWVFPLADGAVIERHVPALALSRDTGRLAALRFALALYRMVFGQPRQEELVRMLQARLPPERIDVVVGELRIDLEPPLL